MILVISSQLYTKCWLPKFCDKSYQVGAVKCNLETDKRESNSQTRTQTIRNYLESIFELLESDIIILGCYNLMKPPRLPVSNTRLN